MIPDTEVLKLAKHSSSAEERSTSISWPCCQDERRKVTKDLVAVNANIIKTRSNPP